MNMEGDWAKQIGPNNKYQYNEKELNDDFGLNWNDYGARFYDAAIGRWNSLDLLAETISDNSPYQYVFNNPISFNDPTGLMGTDVIYDFDGKAHTISDDDVTNIYSADGENKEETNEENEGDCPDPPCGFDARQRAREKAVLNGEDIGGKKMIEGMEAEMNGAIEGVKFHAIGKGLQLIFRGGQWLYVAARGTQIVKASNLVTVGRWMSKAEYDLMIKTSRMVEGAGGQTFVATGGSTAFTAAAKGSVYVEFQVAKNSLIQGGQANWFKALGPSASNSQKFVLNKQGGELLPEVTNLTKVLKVK